jgi:hypothetical protein
MASAYFEHSDEARSALRAIVSDPAHGPDSLDDGQIVANLLEDLLPDAPREAGILTSAARKRVAAMMREQVDHGLSAATAIRLAASSFASTTAFAPDACEWAARELAVALGLVTAEELLHPDTEVSAEPTVVPPPRQEPSTIRTPVGQRLTGQPPAGQPPGGQPEPVRAAGTGPAPGIPAPVLVAGRTSRRRGMIAVLAAVVVVAGAAIGGYEFASAHGRPAAGSTPPAPSVRSTHSRPSAPPPTSAQASQGAQSPSPVAGTPSAAPDPAPRATAGPDNTWIAQLASISKAAGDAALNHALASVRAEVPNAQVLDSSQYSSFVSGFWVIYDAGPFADGAQAVAYCAAHGRTTRNQCVGRYVSHDSGDFGDQCNPPASSPSGDCYEKAPR